MIQTSCAKDDMTYLGDVFYLRLSSMDKFNIDLATTIQKIIQQTDEQLQKRREIDAQINLEQQSKIDHLNNIMENATEK
jgi:hypothetical protein